MMFVLGDVIEPYAGQTLVTPGQYTVLRLYPESVQLSRLPTEEELEYHPGMNYTIFMPIGALELFRLVSPLDDEPR